MVSGLPRKTKTTIEMSITKKRKLVPQRGCKVVNGRAPSASRLRPFSKAWIDLVLRAVVLEHPPHVLQPADRPTGRGTNITTRMTSIDDVEPETAARTSQSRQHQRQVEEQAQAQGEGRADRAPRACPTCRRTALALATRSSLAAWSAENISASMPSAIAFDQVDAAAQDRDVQERAGGGPRCGRAACARRCARPASAQPWPRMSGCASSRPRSRPARRPRGPAGGPRAWSGWTSGARKASCSFMSRRPVRCWIRPAGRAGLRRQT